MIYAFDIETTCGDAQAARIVEYALIGDSLNIQGRCNPGIPITPEATGIHGITDADVADCLPFGPAARQIAFVLSDVGSILIGHSPYVLDIPVLAREFEIAGVEFDWSKLTVIDTQGLEAVAVPRKLSAIYQRMFLKPLEGSHGASSDAQACLDIFVEMRHRYPDFRGKTEAELALLSTHGKRVADPFGKLAYDDKNRLCFNFGQKTRGVPVLEDIGFAEWVLKKEFPEAVKQLIRTEIGQNYGGDLQDEHDSEQPSLFN